MSQLIDNELGDRVKTVDTISRGVKKIATDNSTFISKQGNTCDFNINTKLNKLNIKSLILTKWVTIEINYKIYEVASISFTPFRI